MANQDNARTETPLERAARIGCVHPYFLAWAGRCENCRTTPLSPSLPDPRNPGRDQGGMDHPE
jgi:hypothetical protein